MDKGGPPQSHSLQLDTVTQAERDALRGWNDPPASLGGAVAAPRAAARRRHYVNPDPAQGGIATLDAQQPPPPDMPAKLASSVEDAAPAANVQPVPEAPLLSPQEVSAMLSDALDRILANTDARRADDVRKRLKPLQCSLDNGALSSGACAQLGALLQAVDQGNTDAAHEQQVQIVLRYGTEVGTAAVALKKLIQVASQAQ